MGRLGVLSGSIMMEHSALARRQTQSVSTVFGEALAVLTDSLALILRHGHDPAEYILPHRINHRANLQALRDLGVSEVIGINSTGSLKRELPPGTIIIPDDFITLTATPTIHATRAVHITPVLSENVRRKLAQAARQAGIDAVETGVYWQVTGPRLETRAEIRMMANFADIVGMTMANEAVIAQELDLPYASVCSVDNFGHGLIETPLTLEEIIAGTRKNADVVIRILESYLHLFT
ncbi:MAG TPA: MTAP family purine nucleoside phosphorylase [Smithellaceae bacterium]|nr:MTAP family purine nucleoside phosphorylase [Smithellaceae bacterium]